MTLLICGLTTRLAPCGDDAAIAVIPRKAMTSKERIIRVKILLIINRSFV